MKMTQRTKIIGVVEMIEKHKLQDGLKVAVLNDGQNITSNGYTYNRAQSQGLIIIISLLYKTLNRVLSYKKEVIA